MYTIFIDSLFLIKNVLKTYFAVESFSFENLFNFNSKERMDEFAPWYTSS